MPYITLKNTVLIMSPEELATSQGWVVSEEIARHDGCFGGVILAPFSLLPGLSYVVKYIVSEFTFGTVYPIVATINGIVRNSLGEFTQTFVVPEDATDLTFKFYSDGTLGIRLLQMYPLLLEDNNAITFGFSISDNKFTSYYSLPTDTMLKFINDLFCFKDGRLWKQNVNPIRNNFFGVQGTSKIRFICNVDYQKNKLFYNLRLDSKGSWWSPAMTTPVTDQFPAGQETLLGTNNFKLVDGKLWADILGDLKDPRFSGITPLSLRRAQALFKGRKMQGCYLIVDLEVADTSEVKLTSVEVYYIDAERAF